MKKDQIALIHNSYDLKAPMILAYFYYLYIAKFKISQSALSIFYQSILEIYKGTKMKKDQTALIDETSMILHIFITYIQLNLKFQNHSKNFVYLMQVSLYKIVLRTVFWGLIITSAYLLQLSIILKNRKSIYVSTSQRKIK